MYHLSEKQVQNWHANQIPFFHRVNSMDNIEEDLSVMIKTKQYGSIRDILGKFRVDPNLEINFDFVYATGFEYAILSHDWKMALIFFVYGADPEVKVFDGNINVSMMKRNAEQYKTTNIQNFPSYCSEDIQNLHMFDRLRSLASWGEKNIIDNPPGHYSNENESIFLLYSCLWLMEIANGDVRVGSQRDIQRLIALFSQLNNQLKHSKRRLDSTFISLDIYLQSLKNIQNKMAEQDSKLIRPEYHMGNFFSELNDIITFAMKEIAHAI